jgi:hypothetical protein
MNTTNTIRKTLIDALDRANRGELSAADGKNIIGLANQISQSMAVEVKVLETKIKMGHQTEKFGELTVC